MMFEMHRSRAVINIDDDVNDGDDGDNDADGNSEQVENTNHLLD
jgi:hypothetical protein